MQSLEQVDAIVMESINAHAVPGFHQFFYAFTQLGSTYVWIGGLSLYLLVGKKTALAAVLLLAILFGAVINEDLKDMIQRPRPGGSILPSYVLPYSYSFPSGHAQLTFMIATVLTAFLAWRYSMVTYFFAAAISFSRIYLGVHYLTDVTAGALLGIALGELVIFGLYRYGMARSGGIIGRLAGAGFAARAADIEEDRTALALIICTCGLAIGASAMVAGSFTISLLIIAIVYCAVVMLPEFSADTPGIL